MKGLDLFSGPGGMTLGFKRSGIIPVASVEYHMDAMDTYTGHTPDAEHFRADIRTLSFEKYAGKINVIYGGPPCQPFSTGGLRRAAGDARNMFPEFIRAVREVQPDAFVAENVPGLSSKGSMNYLAELINTLTALGYNLSWRVLAGVNYGLPQKRKRLFIVGFRNSEFWFPKPTHGPTTDKPYVLSGSILSHEPIGEPPDCPVVFAKYPDPRPSPYAGHVYNGGGRPVNLQDACHTVLATAGGCKTHWIDTQNIAPDYSAHLLSGGKPWTGIVPGARRMTVQESAMIQTFPKDMVFVGSRSSQFRQVGDAVPPDLAEVVGSAIVSQLNGCSISRQTHLPSETVLQHVVTT